MFFFFVKLRVLVPLWLNFHTLHFATKTLRHKENSALREPSFNRGMKTVTSVSNLKIFEISILKSPNLQIIESQIIKNESNRPHKKIQLQNAFHN